MTNVGRNNNTELITEVSESAFEYLLAEVLFLPLPQIVDANALSQRLDSMGYSVGYRYVEKVVADQKILGSEPLDLVKFLCKEFWEELFKKKVI